MGLIYIHAEFLALTVKLEVKDCREFHCNLYKSDGFMLQRSTAKTYRILEQEHAAND